MNKEANKHTGEVSGVMKDKYTKRQVNNKIDIYEKTRKQRK